MRLELIVFFLLNMTMSFAQSMPENDLTEAIKTNGVKKCLVFKDSAGVKIPYYELHFNEKGLNTKRIMDTDIDNYNYNDNNSLVHRSFCLNGDSSWCLSYKYVYDKLGLINFVIFSPMNSMENELDSTIYIYENLELSEKHIYKNGVLWLKTLISKKEDAKGSTVLEKTFEHGEIVETAEFRYNINNQLVFRKYQYESDKPTFTTVFKYDSTNRETSYISSSGDKSPNDTTNTYYQENGLISRIETPDFTLYFEYEY